MPIKRWKAVESGVDFDSVMLKNCTQAITVYAKVDDSGNYTSLRVDCYSESVAAYTINPKSQDSFNIDDVDFELAGYVFTAGFFLLVPLYAVSFGLNMLLKIIGYR